MDRETLKKEIFEKEPIIDLLHDLLGFGRFAEVIITSDNFFLGRKHCDVGFNEFLGLPSENAVHRTRELFQKLSHPAKVEVFRIFLSRGFPLNYLMEGIAPGAVSSKTVRIEIDPA